MKKKEITISHLAKMIKIGFDGVDKRFDSVDRRFDSVEGRLGNLENDMDAVKTRLDNVAYRFEVVDLDKRLRIVETKLDLR